MPLLALIGCRTLKHSKISLFVIDISLPYYTDLIILSLTMLSYQAKVTLKVVKKM